MRNLYQVRLLIFVFLLSFFYTRYAYMYTTTSLVCIHFLSSLALLLGLYNTHHKCYMDNVQSVRDWGLKGKTSFSFTNVHQGFFFLFLPFFVLFIIQSSSHVYQNIPSFLFFSLIFFLQDSKELIETMKTVLVLILKIYTAAHVCRYCCDFCLWSFSLIFYFSNDGI